MLEVEHFKVPVRINLDRMTFLLIDDNPQALDILAQVVSGFGVRQIIKSESVEMAKQIIEKHPLDFIITDDQMPGVSGYQFIEWLRSEAGPPNNYVPAIVVTGHSRLAQVKRSRDCGAHFMVAKPITPKVLLDRIMWISRDDRPYIETETYCGPDRRFKREGPPPGTKGRRAEDRGTVVGEAVTPNLSQDEINNMLKPSKVQI
jgi:DNA-binding response OmpR family regulator